MLKLVMGRAHRGKSRYLLEQLCANAPLRSQLLIVPEQHSHNSERALAALGGAQLALHAEVLSFTRLCSRVFAEGGGLAAPTLDEGGRMLLLHRTLDACAGELRLLRRTRPAFLASLLQTLDECKAFCISPDQLYAAAGSRADETADKLRDLGFILDAYNALLAQTALDPRDRLTQLAEQLCELDWCRSKDIAIDGFTDFTGQERDIIAQMLRQANSVTIALTCDRMEQEADGLDIFAPARRTAHQLTALAQRLGVPCELLIRTEPLAPLNPALACVEQHLFSTAELTFKGAQAVAFHTAQSVYGELEWAAATIRKMVQEQDLRYRDFAVVARSMEPHGSLAEVVFARYEVPLFFARKSPLLEQPVLILVRAALDTIASNYHYEPLFRYLKTGLTGFAQTDIDRLENYALTWKLRGSNWTARKPWSKHPQGFQSQWAESDTALLTALDALRRQIVAPLEQLRKSAGDTIGAQAKAFYDFLTAIALPLRLAERAKALAEQGAATAAEELRQVWGMLCQGLDQCVAISGEVPGDLEDFSRLFLLILGQYELGTIPVSLDRVTMQEYSRLGAKRPRILLLLGADDGAIPQVSLAGGILSEQERELLGQAGIELSPPADLRLLREMTMVYECCTAPTDRLLLSFVEHGEQSAPSFVWHRLRELFPAAPATREEQESDLLRLCAPLPALEIAARHPAAEQALAAVPEYADRLLRMKRTAVLHRGALTAETVGLLYADRLPMSASRLDRLQSCHFSDYMRYTLAAQERIRADFNAPVYGTFVHFVLEWVLKGMGGGRSVAPDALGTLIEQAMDAFAQTSFGDLAEYSARHRYLFLRQRETVRTVAEDLVEELLRSRFTPVGHELGFGKNRKLPPLLAGGGDSLRLELGGFVDRVDGFMQGEEHFLRVLDYKTGRKKIDWTAMRHGMGLQMLLYLFALQERGSAALGGTIAPAGVLYVPARDPVVDGDFTMTEEKRFKARWREIRRSGLVLGDEAILAAMETPPDGEEERFLPTDRISAEDFARLRGHVHHVLDCTAADMTAGVITADPYYRSERDTACIYCPYHSACHFEEGCGDDRRRYLKTVKADEFWSQITKEEGAADGTIFSH
jgi:ATP-dependent nuclease, subunit B